MHPLSWFRGHSRWQELVDRAIAGDLSPGDEARLTAHLDGCGACAARLADHRALRHALSTALPAVNAPRSFAITPEMLAERAPAAAPAPAPRRSLRAAMALQGVGAAAAVAALGLLALDISSGSSNDAALTAGNGNGTQNIEMAAGAGDDDAGDGADGAAGTTQMLPEPPPNPGSGVPEADEADAGPETMAGDEPSDSSADANEETARQGEGYEPDASVTALTVEEPAGDDDTDGLVIASIVLGAVAAVTLTSGLAVRLGAGRRPR